EIQLYTAARDEYRRWLSNPCEWRPDKDLAAQYKLNYDPVPFCITGQAPSNYSPAYNYFIAYALLRDSYGKAISDATGGPQVQYHTTLSLGLALGAVAVPAAAVSGLVVGALIFAFIKQIIPFAFRTFGSLAAGAGGTGAVAGTIVFLAVVAGVVAGFQIF